MYRFRRQEGALLANLLVGMAIMLTLIAVSIPNFRRYQESVRMDDAARALVANLRYAQQLAITEQKAYGVLVNEGIGTYQVVKVDPADSPATTTVKTVALPTDIDFDSVTGFDYDFIRYNSYGSVHQSGEIVLENMGGASSTIEIKPSGYVDF